MKDIVEVVKQSRELPEKELQKLPFLSRYVYTRYRSDRGWKCNMNDRDRENDDAERKEQK